MNSKGFTLIELLATITIIGLVALITVPVVTRIIKDTEHDIFESNQTSLKDAAKAYYSINIDSLPIDLVTVETVTLDTLIGGGYIKEMRNPDDNNVLCQGYVEVRQTQVNVYEYTPFLDCGGEYETPGYIH